MWKVVFTKQAAKDAKKLKAAGLDGKAKKLIDVVRKTLLQPITVKIALNQTEQRSEPETP